MIVPVLNWSILRN